MAEEKKYSFITVETDDDDDIVIQAGSPVEPAPVVEPCLSAQPASAPIESEPVESAAVEPEAVEAFDDSASDVAPSSQEEAPETFAAPAAPKKAKSGYRETTLEDLDAAPMGTTQKVVIAAAVIAVIAFIAWYVLF